MFAAFLDTLVERAGINFILFLGGALLSFVIGRWWGRYLAARAWHRKDFTGRIIVSLNAFDEGKLLIRTILERSLEEIFLNSVAVERIQDGAKQTTLANPFLPIAPEDVWFLHNFVLNAVAEQFTTGLAKLDAGQSVARVTWVIALTCEVVGDERIRKVRALLVRRDHLENFPYPETLPQLENPWHDVRVDTLRKWAIAYQQNPKQFLSMEVCV